MVNLLFTVEPRVSGGTLAEVASIRVVSTAPTVRARSISARHGTQLAIVAIETMRASAGICVFQILQGENRTGLTQSYLLSTAATNCSILNFFVLHASFVLLFGSISGSFREGKDKVDEKK